MSMPQDQLFGSLYTLNSALTANAADLPELELSRARFEALILQMQETASLQAALTARKQEATEQLQALMADASRIASALRSGIKVHYGPRSQKLVEFGIQPFRSRRRSPKPELEEPGASAE